MNSISSFKIGGDGMYAEVYTKEELEACISQYKERYRIIPISHGTNMVFGNALETYLFLRPKFDSITIDEETDEHVVVTAGAWHTFDALVEFVVAHGWWGIENLSAIPGSVGASVIQNIGAYGMEVCSSVVAVEAFDTMNSLWCSFDNASCEFDYRDSLFKREQDRYIVWTVSYIFYKKGCAVRTYVPLTELPDAATLYDIRKVVCEVRAKKLPDYHTSPNCGSFFMNPVIEKVAHDVLLRTYPHMPKYMVSDREVKVPAAWLVEHVALMKGVEIDGVMSAPTQALVLVNTGAATHEALSNYIRTIQRTIKEKTGISLTPEVRSVPGWDAS